MKTRCLIVDDEPLSVKLIRSYTEELDDFIVVGEAKNALEALKMIESESVDLIFLDINMPRISGIELVKSLQNPPKIIIASAYKEYAIEGFELNVVDFLLKPFAFERFLRAINKYKSRFCLQNYTPKENSSNTLSIKENKKFYNIELDSILYIESLREYVKFYLDSGHILVKYSLTKLAEGLPNDQFIRIHKSYIVAVNKVKMVSATHVNIADKRIPVGRNFKPITNKTLSQKGIVFD